MDQDELIPVFIKLPVEHIVSIQFLIESYEGIGIVRTLDRHKGEIVVLALPDTISVLTNLLDSLADDLSLRVVPPPDSLKDDWLLSSWKDPETPEPRE